MNLQKTVSSRCVQLILLFFTKYTGDLKNKHLNTEIYLFAIQMPRNSLLFKPGPE